MLTRLLRGPILRHLRVDPIHVDIIRAMNIEIRLRTSPFGVNIFVARASSNLKLRDIHDGIVQVLASISSR